MAEELKPSPLELSQDLQASDASLQAEIDTAVGETTEAEARIRKNKNVVSGFGPLVIDGEPDSQRE